MNNDANIPLAELNRLNNSITRIETHLEYLKSGMTELKDSLKLQNELFITRVEHQEFTKRIDADIKAVSDASVTSKEFDSYKRMFWVVMSGVAATLIGMVMSIFRLESK